MSDATIEDVLHIVRNRGIRAHHLHRVVTYYYADTEEPLPAHITRTLESMWRDVVSTVQHGAAEYTRNFIQGGLLFTESGIVEGYDGLGNPVLAPHGEPRPMGMQYGKHYPDDYEDLYIEPPHRIAIRGKASDYLIEVDVSSDEHNGVVREFSVKDES